MRTRRSRIMMAMPAISGDTLPATPARPPGPLVLVAVGDALDDPPACWPPLPVAGAPPWPALVLAALVAPPGVPVEPAGGAPPWPWLVVVAVAVVVLAGSVWVGVCELLGGDV
ncbi:MAG: hypothetical protein LRS49_06240, partial [Desulfurococcales archaeon]|nr:hypothetical protein [Desulfurococcales archaeon]